MIVAAPLQLAAKHLIFGAAKLKLIKIEPGILRFDSVGRGGFIEAGDRTLAIKTGATLVVVTAASTAGASFAIRLRFGFGAQAGCTAGSRGRTLKTRRAGACGAGGAMANIADGGGSGAPRGGGGAAYSATSSGGARLFGQLGIGGFGAGGPRRFVAQAVVKMQRIGEWVLSGRRHKARFGEHPIGWRRRSRPNPRS